MSLQQHNVFTFSLPAFELFRHIESLAPSGLSVTLTVLLLYFIVLLSCTFSALYLHTPCTSLNTHSHSRVAHSLCLLFCVAVALFSHSVFPHTRVDTLHFTTSRHSDHSHPCRTLLLQVNKMHASAMNLDQQVMALEGAAQNVDIMDAMTAGRDEFKNIAKKM